MKKLLCLSALRISLLFIEIIICTAPFAQGFSPEAEAKRQHVIDSFQHNPDTPAIGGVSAAINVDGLAIWKGAAGFGV